MTLTRRAGLTRRGGLSATTGILNRGTGLKRRALDNTVAPSPRRQRKTRAAAKADLDIPPATRELLRARSAGRCEALLAVAGCTQAATDAHHRQRRRDGGHGIANLVDLCRSCHRWAHLHPEQARELGLIVSVYEEPATVPVRLLSRLTGRRRPVLLLADGAYLTEADA